MTREIFQGVPMSLTWNVCFSWTGARVLSSLQSHIHPWAHSQGVSSIWGAGFLCRSTAPWFAEGGVNSEICPWKPGNEEVRNLSVFWIDIYPSICTHTKIYMRLFKCTLNIFCVIRSFINISLFILFHASCFLYIFPFCTFFRVIGSCCTQFYWNIKSLQSPFIGTSSVIMIHYFKIHIFEKRELS